MKKAGIIGGMGPLATVQFFNRIVEHTDAHSDQEHINLLISNHATLPDRTRSILEKREVEFLNAIKEDFEIMNREAVDCIVIPCNTSHAFYKEYLTMTNIPIINMVEETVKEIKDSAVVFGTRGTISLELYQLAGKKFGKTIITPQDEEQIMISQSIQNVKNKMILEAPAIEALIDKYKKDYQIIFACTELSCLKIEEENRLWVVDAMDILTKRLIEYMGKTYKELSD